MINFELSIPTKIIFGKGSIQKLGREILKNGKRVLLVYGKNSIKDIGLYDEILQIFRANHIEAIELSGIKPNPSVKDVRKGIELCRKNNIELILGVGGGSVIDSIKSIAAGVYYQGDVWDFYTGKAKPEKSVPVASVLTLAATGSEANGGSVISNEDTQEKFAFTHPMLKPVFSILDPEYTFNLPANQTSAGVADIMSHCIEQYFTNTQDTFIQDRLTEAILKTCIHYGPVLVNEPKNYDARANIMWASTLALNGIIGAGKEGDWATHIIEHKVSAISDLTHGIGLAIITPHWLNEVLDENNTDKFADFATNVFGITDIADKMLLAKAGINKLDEFFRKMNIPSKLSATGFIADDELFKKMADDILKNGNIGKFKKLDATAIIRILKASY